MLYEEYMKRAIYFSVLNFAMKKLCYFGCALGLMLTLQSCSFFGGPVIKTVTIESYQTQCTMPSYPFVQTLCMVMVELDETIQLITGR